MSIAAAVKKAIGYESDHWKLELPDTEREAHYQNDALVGMDAWFDAYRMECAEKHVAFRRLYQNMPVFDI